MRTEFAALFAAFTLSTSLALAEDGPCGEPYLTEVTSPYAIDGVWMEHESNACAWQENLERFHSIGGTKVMQFGTELRESSRADFEDHEDFTFLEDCQFGGEDCILNVLDETEAVLSGRSIRWLRYRDGKGDGRGRSFFGDDVVQCENLDQHYTFSGDGVQYHVLRVVVPMDGWSGSCVLPSQGEVAVILVAYATVPGGAAATYESQTALLESAEALGVDVYLAGPKIPAARDAQGEATANADPELFEVHLEWAKRFTQDALTRYGSYSSFVGFYQSREVPLKGNGNWTLEEYDYYRRDVEAIKSVPGAADLKYIISPYMRGYGVSPEEAAEGFERLAETGVDAILPQDRRGGGRSALYWPYEGHKVIASGDVDPILAGYKELAGSYYNELYLETLDPLEAMALYMENGTVFHPDVTTFDELFVGGTYEFYAALGAKRTELRNDGIAGNDAELWANVEAYDKNDLHWPNGYTTTEGSNNDSCPTTKARLDRALTMEAGGSDQVVSFQWPYFWKDQPTDDGSGNQSSSPWTLESEILSTGYLPIVTNAYKATSNGVKGINIRGYNLSYSNVRFTVTWWNTSGDIQAETVSAFDSGGWRNPTWGTQKGRSPLMETVFVPIDMGNLKPNFYVHIRAKLTNGETASARYSILY